MATNLIDGDSLTAAIFASQMSIDHINIHDDIANLSDITLAASDLLANSTGVTTVAFRDITVSASVAVPANIKTLKIICRNLTIAVGQNITNSQGAAGGTSSSTAGNNGGSGYYKAGGTESVPGSNSYIQGLTIGMLSSNIPIYGAGGGGGTGSATSSGQGDPGYISGSAGGSQSGGAAGGTGPDGARGGGGIIIICLDTLTINGSIIASGASASNGVTNAGGAGGGAGGVIFIVAKTLAGTGSITANGGNGSSKVGGGVNNGGAGGNGGLIKIFSSTAANPYTLSVTGGTGGTGNTNGTNGNAGVTVYTQGRYV